jgi:hypothetical protein
MNTEPCLQMERVFRLLSRRGRRPFPESQPNWAFIRFPHLFTTLFQCRRPLPVYIALDAMRRRQGNVHAAQTLRRQCS